LPGKYIGDSVHISAVAPTGYVDVIGFAHVVRVEVYESLSCVLRYVHISERMDLGYANVPTYPGRPVDSITFASVTSSDHTSNCHLHVPITPQYTLPECTPMRMSTARRLLLYRCRAVSVTVVAFGCDLPPSRISLRKR
jgi:hypothetical protein